jgi:hypothetical protein
VGCAERGGGGVMLLTCRPPPGPGIAGYDVFRAEDGGAAIVVEAVKGAKYADRTVLGGLTYTYHVMAYDSSGRHSPPSNSIVAAMQMPDLSSPSPAEPSHA